MSNLTNNKELKFKYSKRGFQVFIYSKKNNAQKCRIIASPEFIELLNIITDTSDKNNFDYELWGKLSQMEKNFMYKLDQFDGPLGKLITEYNSTNDVTAKNEIKNKIEKLKDDFNNKTKVKGQGYLDEVEFKFGNKVKLIDNTPLISDLTNKNVYENILRNVNHSNKFFEKEGLQKYIVKGDDF